MQTRKRAKPVKFGVKEEEPTVEEPKEVVVEKKHHVVHHEEEHEHPKKHISHQEIVDLPQEDGGDDDRRIGPIIISQNVNVDQATDKDEEPKTTFTSFTEAKKEETEEPPMITATPQEEESDTEEIAEETEIVEEEVPIEEEETPEPIRIAPEPDSKQTHEENPFRQQETEQEEELPVRKSAFFTRESSGFGGGNGGGNDDSGGFTPRTDDAPSEETPPTDPRETYFSDAEETRGKSSFVFFLKVVFITFVLGILAIGALSYFSGGKTISLDSMGSLFSFAKPTATPTKTPEPTPTAEPVDPGAYTIAIQNGSGITGEAAKLKTALAEEGFKIEGTGNADNSNYTSTQISAKESVSDGYLEKLKSDLGQNYKVANAILPAADSQSTDVLIIIGSETAN